MKSGARLTLAATVLLVLLAAMPSFAQYPFPSGRSLAVTGTFKPGECPVVSGGGYKPGSIVTVRLNGKVVGTAVADGDGNFFFEVCLPLSLAGTNVTITASGVSPSGAARTQTFSANLAKTGSNTRTMATLALAAIIAGGLLFSFGRRRSLSRA